MDINIKIITNLACMKRRLFTRSDNIIRISIKKKKLYEIV